MKEEGELRIQVQDCIVLVIFYKSKEESNKYSNSTSILFSLLYYVYQRMPKNED